GLPFPTSVAAMQPCFASSPRRMLALWVCVTLSWAKPILRELSEVPVWKALAKCHQQRTSRYLQGDNATVNCDVSIPADVAEKWSAYGSLLEASDLGLEALQEVQRQYEAIQSVIENHLPSYEALTQMYLLRWMSTLTDEIAVQAKFKNFGINRSYYK
ncbi:unnamed protein product, partial [Durusdinium trenchii]